MDLFSATHTKCQKDAGQQVDLFLQGRNLLFDVWARGLIWCLFYSFCPNFRV